MREIEKAPDGTEHIIIAKLVGKLDTEDRLRVEPEGAKKDVLKIVVMVLDTIMKDVPLPPQIVEQTQTLNAMLIQLVNAADELKKTIMEKRDKFESTGEDIDISWMKDALGPEKPEDEKH